jgi:hypothetical protein
MTAYSDIRGYRVKYLASDPTLNTSTEGQVWYNSTEGVLKSLVQIKAWSSGGNMTNTRDYSSGVGTQTDMLAISGQQATAMTTATEEYSGYTWTAGGAVNSARRAAYGFGTPTAAVIAGGDYVGSPGGPLSTATEEYNGSAWTGGGTLVSQGSFGASAGTLTAGLAFGGYNTAQTASSTVTASYDGTSWTSLPSPGSDTNNARNFTRGGGGTQTAAIFSGGYSNPIATNGALTESWDGSTWTNENNMGTARYGQGFLGTQASGLYAGGATPSKTNVTEEWSGSTWSTSSASLSTARNGSALSQGGSLNAAAIAGGYTGTTYPTATEEYNSNINAITKAAWASGGNLTTARYVLAGAGTQTAGLAFGGRNPGDSNATEEYNGTSWGPGGNLGTARRALAGAGTQTAGLAFGGFTSPPNVYQSATEEYDGSAWTAGGTLTTTRGYLSGCGTQTAGLGFGGYDTPGNTNATEEYDGTSWAAGGNLNTARRSLAGAGSQTAGLGFGGYDTTGVTEEYNGSNWVNSAPLATARRALAGAGTQASGLAFGGIVATALNNTEEYTGGTETATASTLTTS